LEEGFHGYSSYAFEFRAFDRLSVFFQLEVLMGKFHRFLIEGVEDAQHSFRSLVIVSSVGLCAIYHLNIGFSDHSAILTTLQIGAVADQPIARYSALMSLVCALMSLLYGCIYIIRFGTMRKTHKAAEWAAVSISVVCKSQANFVIQPSGGSEDKNENLVECMGAACDALNMAVLVNQHLLLCKLRINDIVFQVHYLLSGVHHVFRMAHGFVS
jgi:hypothetical protein